MGAAETDLAVLLERAAAGNQDAVNDLFARYRDRLRAMVRLRLNRRLQGRVDPSDVLQDAYLEISKGIGAYLEAPKLPLRPEWSGLVHQQRIGRLRKFR